MWVRPEFPVHKPRRRWWNPLERVCACGLDAWPCPVKIMLDRQAQMPRQRNTGPAWNESTISVRTVEPSRPLLTPGQAARACEGEHRLAAGP